MYAFYMHQCVVRGVGGTHVPPLQKQFIEEIIVKYMIHPVLVLEVQIHPQTWDMAYDRVIIRIQCCLLKSKKMSRGRHVCQAQSGRCNLDWALPCAAQRGARFPKAVRNTATHAVLDSNRTATGSAPSERGQHYLGRTAVGRIRKTHRRRHPVSFPVVPWQRQHEGVGVAEKEGMKG
jgi:hypothetical protein